MQHSRERCTVHLIACWRTGQSRGDVTKQLHQSRHQTKGYIALGPARHGQTCAKSGQIYPPPTHYLTHAGSLLFWALYLAVPPLCELIVYNLCCVSLCNSVGNLPRSWRWPQYRFWDSLKAVRTWGLSRVDYTSRISVNITYKVFKRDGLQGTRWLIRQFLCFNNNNGSLKKRKCSFNSFPVGHVL